MAIDPRAEVLKKLIGEHDLKLRDIAREAEITNWQDIQNWIGGTKPQARKSPQLDAALASARSMAQRRAKRVASTPMGSIRIVGNVAAGDGTINVDSDLDVLLVPLSLTGEDRLGWIVEGDSMMPELQAGDVAVFKEHRDPRNRMVYLAKLPEKGLVCKECRWDRAGNVWRLHSLNPNYEPLDMNGVELLGFLVGYYRVRGYKEKFASDPDGLHFEDF